jgi:hypothetical protein
MIEPPVHLPQTGYIQIIRRGNHAPQWKENEMTMSRVLTPAWCPWCQKGTMHPMVDERGELFTTQVQLIPQDMPIIGGRNFLAAYKLCQECGYTATFNLNLLEPAQKLP